MVRLTSGNLAEDEEDDVECTPNCLPLSAWIDHSNPSRQDSAQSAADEGSDAILTSTRPRRASSPVRSAIKSKKKQLDTIYYLTVGTAVIHACCALGVGAGALVYPDMFEIFMNLEHESGGCHRISEQANTIIRLYGALILSQAWLVWKTRSVPDPFVRKMFAEGYLLCFSLSALVLAYKQLFSSEWRPLNWPVIVFFFAFSGVYAWFLLTKKLPEYDRPGAAVV